MSLRDVMGGSRSKVVDIEIADALLSDELAELTGSTLPSIGPDTSTDVAVDTNAYSQMLQIGEWLRYARQTYGERDS